MSGIKKLEDVKVEETLESEFESKEVKNLIYLLNWYISSKDEKVLRFLINFQTFKKLRSYSDINMQPFRVEIKRKFIEKGLYGYWGKISLFIDKTLNDDFLVVCTNNFPEGKIIDLQDSLWFEKKDNRGLFILQDFINYIENCQNITFVTDIKNQKHLIYYKDTNIVLGELHIVEEEVLQDFEKPLRAVRTIVKENVIDFLKLWKVHQKHLFIKNSSPYFFSFICHSCREEIKLSLDTLPFPIERACKKYKELNYFREVTQKDINIPL